VIYIVAGSTNGGKGIIESSNTYFMEAFNLGIKIPENISNTNIPENIPNTNIPENIPNTDIPENITNTNIIPVENTQNIIYINCGGNTFIDQFSNQWLKDILFIDPNIKTKSLMKKTKPSITNTDLDILYHSERFAKQLIYIIPELNNQKNYLVKLHFAEIYFDSFDKRVFDVYLNNEPKPIESKLDIFSQVGKNASLIKEYTIAPINNTIIIKLISIKNNSKISAIEIIELNKE